MLLLFILFLQFVSKSLNFLPELSKVTLSCRSDLAGRSLYKTCWRLLTASVPNVSGWTNLRPNFGRIFSQQGPKRGRVLKMFCFLYFFHMKALKIWNFHRFQYYCGFKILSYFDKMILEILHLQVAEFFSQRPKFLVILAGKCWKELATLLTADWGGSCRCLRPRGVACSPVRTRHPPRHTPCTPFFSTWSTHAL